MCLTPINQMTKFYTVTFMLTIEVTLNSKLSLNETTLLI